MLHGRSLMHLRFVPGFAALVFGLTSAAQADVLLPRIFGDHMVLQADQPIPVWGQADPGEAVQVQFAGVVVNSKANKQGRWRVNLPALAASFKPQTLTVKGRNEVAFSAVLVGEVWLASGQSNMEWSLAKADGGTESVAQASDQSLRLFQVLHGSRLPENTTDVDAAWAVASPQSSANFSAIGFWFGQRLRQSLQRPVAIIDSSWGGTPVEAWTSRQGLASVAEGRHLLAQNKVRGPRTHEQKAAELQAYQGAHDAWQKANRQVDAGNAGEAQGFARPGLAETGWQKMNMPSHWEDEGLDGDGAVWFRKDLPIPKAWVGQDLELHLGALNDCDTIYVNGTKVAESCWDTPQTHAKPRMVRVPGTLVKPGRLLVAVRIFDERGNGGFSSSAESVFVRAVAGGETMSLAGRWNVRPEKLLPTLNVRWDLEPKPPRGHPHPNGVHALWDAMVAPMVPFGIKGVLWYQGEANASRAVQYRALFAGMITDWRRQWGQNPLPFYFVQLAGFRAPGHPAEWPELREAQTMALRLPQTGMAVAIDIGNPKDIHPTNKFDVAQRLSRWALARTYGQQMVASGPLYKRMQVQGNRVRLWFDHADGLRVADGASALGAFEVAGRDRNFVAAVAEIDGDTVVVRAPEVTSPAAVRYGWQGVPPCNLQNAEGLPASPFRTDKWLEITRGRR